VDAVVANKRGILCNQSRFPPLSLILRHLEREIEDCSRRYSGVIAGPSPSLSPGCLLTLHAPQHREALQLIQPNGKVISRTIRIRTSEELSFEEVE
jgi:hypothetical protein